MLSVFLLTLLVCGAVLELGQLEVAGAGAQTGGKQRAKSAWVRRLRPRRSLSRYVVGGAEALCVVVFLCCVQLLLFGFVCLCASLISGGGERDWDTECGGERLFASSVDRKTGSRL